MPSWVLGAGLAGLLSLLSIAYFWFVRRPRSETAAGLQALAALRWREVSSLIRQAMRQRGLQDAERNTDAPGEDGSRLLMSDGQNRWLLVCKHGMAYRIGLPAIEELVAAMDLSGARRGMLLTQGSAGRDAHGMAERNGIELVDGRRLWPLLKPFVASDTRQTIVAASRRQAVRHILIGMLGAIAIGLVAAVFPARLLQDDIAPATGTHIGLPAAAPAAPASTAAVVAPSRPDAPDLVPAETPATEAGTPDADASTIQADPDEETQARYQAEVARSIGLQPGIGRAYWLTRATLVIDRSGDDAMIWPLICSQIERYPSLRTVRIQLNPRPGHDEPVRWRQCRTI